MLLGQLSGNLASLTIDDNLKGTGTVLVSQDPRRHQNVLESLFEIAEEDLKIAISVPRDLSWHMLLKRTCIESRASFRAAIRTIR